MRNHKIQVIPTIPFHFAALSTLAILVLSLFAGQAYAQTFEQQQKVFDWLPANDEMVRLDLEYARSWTLWTDIRILLKTPRAMLSGVGAY